MLKQGQPSQDMLSCCVSEIKAFAIGGPAGLERLQRVLPNIFRHYGIVSASHQANVLIKCGLMPVSKEARVTFEFDPETV